MSNPNSEFKEMMLENQQKTDELSLAIIKVLGKLVNYFDDFTTYKKSEVIPILLLRQNKYFRKILENLPEIRKFEKGAFKSEVMSTIKDIVQIAVSLSNRDNIDDNNNGFLSNLFHRK